VTCILLNWNGWRDSLACLESLERVTYPKLSVILVDNGSSDGSVAHIRHHHPRLELIENASNLGFSAGNNVGIRAALARDVDYLWLLNNDARPEPGALSALVQRAEEDHRLGAVGSVLRYAHDPRVVQAWGGGRVNIWTGRTAHVLAPVSEGELTYLTAASLLLRRTALAQVGLFDEGYFLYWEDTDLCYRLRARGWRLGVASGSIVLHREHGSTGRDFRLLHRYAVGSGIRFLIKHSPRPWISVCLFISLKVTRKVFTGKLTHVADIARGVQEFLARRKHYSVGRTTERALTK